MSIVMLVVVLIVVVPFGWFILAGKMGVSKKKKEFQKIAEEQQLKLSDVDYWNNICLGFDNQKKVLLYINSNEATTEIKKVELNDVRLCVITKTNKDYKNGDKHYSELSALALEFTFLHNEAPVLMTLFNTSYGFSQNQEMARAEKWLAFIEKHKYDKQNINAA